MNTEEFNKILDSQSNKEVIDLANEQLSELCKNFGKSFRMSIPVDPKDTDIVYGQVIKRLEQSELKRLRYIANLKVILSKVELDLVNPILRITNKLEVIRLESKLHTIKDMIKDAEEIL